MERRGLFFLLLVEHKEKLLRAGRREKHTMALPPAQGQGDSLLISCSCICSVPRGPLRPGRELFFFASRPFEDSVEPPSKSGVKAVFPPIPAEHEEKFSARSAKDMKIIQSRIRAAYLIRSKSIC